MVSGLREKLIWGVGCIATCTGLYTVTNLLSDSFENKHQMFFQWELDIPLIPCFIIIYSSFYPLLILGFLACRTKIELQNLTGQMIFCAIIAAIIFVIFPGELGYTRAEDTGLFKPVYDLLFELDRPSNLYPSLHIAFSYISLGFVLVQTRRAIFKFLFSLWFIGIFSSVILVHQHHIFDILTGLALALLARRVV